MKQFRIACIGDYTVRYSYFTAGIMEGSIRLGHLFRPIPLMQPIKEIRCQVSYFLPHVIFIHQMFNSYHHLEESESLYKDLKTSGIKIALHEGDPKSEPRTKFNLDKYVDIGLINSKCTKQYENYWQIPCYHWPYFCLYQDRIQEPEEQFKSQVAFSGNITKRIDPNHPHHGRAEFLEELGKKVELKIYPDEKMDIKNSRFLTPVIAASSNAVIGIHQGYDVDGYLDTRPFQYIGAGALYFHDKCEAIERFFNDGTHYVGYERKNVDSFLEKYAYYIDNPEKAKNIRQAGFTLCQNNYNAEERVKQALMLMGF